MQSLPLKAGLFHLLGVLLILAVIGLAWHPIWNGEFLWDDSFLVTGNDFIRSPWLALEAFRHFLFTDSRGEFYRPIQTLSYQFDYWRAGLSAPAFHQTSLVIHAANGVLIFLLAEKIVPRLGGLPPLQARWPALLVALLWAAHPVHSATTAYISGRADSLALLGLLIAWFFWEKGVETSPRKAAPVWFVFAGLAALAGCCSKEIGLMFLAGFVLHLWLLRPELSAPLKTRTSLGALLIAGAYLLLRQLPEPNIAPAAAAASSHVMSPVVLFFRALGDYARLLVWPDQLFMERQVSIPTGLFTDPVKNDPLFPYLAWVGSAFLLALLLSVLWQARGQRLRWFGAAWFLWVLLPVSNLLPLNATVAEHWLYLPSIGFFLWITGCLLALPPHFFRPSLLLLSLAVALLGARSHIRAHDWVSASVFYHATIRDGGDSARVRINLAGEYQKRGNLHEAERIYRSVVRVLPDYAPARAALTRNLELQGKLPASSPPAPNASRLDHLRAAYTARPNSWPAARALAHHLQERGQPQIALQIHEGFATRNPWKKQAWEAIGSLQSSAGQPGFAAKSYLTAARLDIRDPQPLNLAAAILADAGQIKEAIRLQKRAIARDPGPRQQALLQGILALPAD